MSLRNQISWPRKLSLGAAAAALVLCAAGSSARAVNYEGWGVRGGFSSDPEQFVIGMHMQLSEIADYFRITPNVDIGFGDDLTVLTLNPDASYEVPVGGAGSFYFGGTLSLVYAKFDNAPEGADDDDTDFGIAGLIGWNLPVEERAVALDLKLGLTDEYPDLKLMVAYTFK